jgi:NAD(P)-dependent dehydrogenase (short-subunit alcohol dehydrogenase family)
MFRQWAGRCCVNGESEGFNRAHYDRLDLLLPIPTSLNLLDSNQDGAGMNSVGVDIMREKKIVLLTGCTGTFGSKFIELYADKYSIVGVARRPPVQHVDTYDYFQADLTENYRGAVDYTLERYGRLDVLINNAASGDIEAALKETRSTSFAYQMQINAVVPFELIRYAFLRFWSRAGRQENQDSNRNVVNMGSILSARHHRLIGGYEGHYNFACYAATKRALSALTKNLSYELERYGVRINLLAPGAFPSEQPTELVCKTCVEIESSTYNGMVATIDFGEVRTLQCECEMGGGRPLELVFSPGSEGREPWM